MVKVTFLKIGYIGTTNLIDALLDERASRKGISQDSVRFLKVLLKKTLYLANHPVTVWQGSHQCRVRQLALVVPLQQIDLGDTQRLAGIDVARDEM